MPENITRKFNEPTIESDSIEALSLKLLKTSEELSRVNRELSDKNEKLAASEKARKEMLANISHDLRAPITAIRGAINLLSSYDSISEEDLKKTIGMVDRRVATLEELIQDMYFLFSVEDESRPLNLETVELAPFLESYFYDTIVDERYDDHEMNLDVPLDLKANVTIDIQKTLRVLDNLFTNAAKYAGPGADITLSASADHTGKKVTITVSDNGAGISPEALPHIFERTYTVSSSRTPNTHESGSGLGLSIVKSVIEKENGSVRCISEPGKGSSFIIELPSF